MKKSDKQELIDFIISILRKRPEYWSAYQKLGNNLWKMRDFFEILPRSNMTSIETQFIEQMDDEAMFNLYGEIMDAYEDKRLSKQKSSFYEEVQELKTILESDYNIGDTSFVIKGDMFSYKPGKASKKSKEKKSKKMFKIRGLWPTYLTGPGPDSPVASVGTIDAGSDSASGDGAAGDGGAAV